MANVVASLLVSSATIALALAVLPKAVLADENLLLNPLGKPVALTVPLPARVRLDVVSLPQLGVAVLPTTSAALIEGRNCHKFSPNVNVAPVPSESTCLV